MSYSQHIYAPPPTLPNPQLKPYLFQNLRNQPVFSLLIPSQNENSLCKLSIIFLLWFEFCTTQPQ